MTPIYTDVSTRLRSSVQFGCPFIDLVGKGNFVDSAGIALLQSTTIHFLHIAGLSSLHCLSREDLVKWQHTQRDRKMFCYQAVCPCYCLHAHLFHHSVCLSPMLIYNCRIFTDNNVGGVGGNSPSAWMDLSLGGPSRPNSPDHAEADAARYSGKKVQLCFHFVVVAFK